MSQETQNPAIVKKPKLLDEVRNALRTKHDRIKTEESYIHWLKKYIFFHNKCLHKEISEEEINQFITHLTAKDNLSEDALLRLFLIFITFKLHQIGFRRGKKPSAAALS